MEIVYKVVRKDRNKLTSCTVEIPELMHDYKKPVQSKYGLFVFENPYWAMRYGTSLSREFRIIKGITDEIKPLIHCLFEIDLEYHERFWNFYFENKKLPDWPDMIDMNLYPYIAPHGTYICHTFQMTHRFIHINKEIENYERSKDNADRETERS